MQADQPAPPVGAAGGGPPESAAPAQAARVQTAPVAGAGATASPVAGAGVLRAWAVSAWGGGRRPLLAAAGLLVAALALAAGVQAVRGPDAGAPASGRPAALVTHRPASPAPTADPDQARLDALTSLLAARGRAVLAHDRSAWTATVDPSSGAFATGQAAVFTNLSGVPFSVFDYQFLGPAPGLSTARQAELGGPAWVARVLAGYRLAGYDVTTAWTEQYLTLVQRGGRWLVASTSDGGTAPQPWDLGPVQVVRGDRVLVLGTAARSTLATYADAGDAAVDRVTGVWGTGWRRRAVLVVPRSQAEFGRLLLRAPDGLGQVAAVTTGELGADDGGTGAAGNDRVVLNPAAFARLGALGRQVVLTHEMTHVAVRSSTSAAVPIWLSEGFADFVGYRGTGVSRATGAADLLAQVRDGHPVTDLPTADDFDPTRTTIAPAYSKAWLACLLVADQHGTRKLVALYRAAARPGPTGAVDDPDARLAAAFPAVLGVSQAAFTASWRHAVSDLAGS